MINMDKITLERIRQRNISLDDLGACGLHEELLKLKVIADFIAFDTDDYGALSIESNRMAVKWIIEDIADNIKKGLDHINKEVLFKLKKNAESGKEVHYA